MFKTALYTPYDVTGQTVLVTGATAGIGEAIVWRFAEMGCKVIATGRRAERLQALAAAVKDRFPDSKLLPYPLDVTDMEAVNKAMPENLAANHPGLLRSTFSVRQNMDIVLLPVSLLFASNRIGVAAFPLGPEPSP